MLLALDGAICHNQRFNGRLCYFIWAARRLLEGNYHRTTSATGGPRATDIYSIAMVLMLLLLLLSVAAALLLLVAAAVAAVAVAAATLAATTNNHNNKCLPPDTS